MKKPTRLGSDYGVLLKAWDQIKFDLKMFCFGRVSFSNNSVII